MMRPPQDLIAYAARVRRQNAARTGLNGLELGRFAPHRLGVSAPDRLASRDISDGMITVGYGGLIVDVEGSFRRVKLELMLFHGDRFVSPDVPSIIEAQEHARCIIRSDLGLHTIWIAVWELEGDHVDLLVQPLPLPDDIC